MTTTSGEAEEVAQGMKIKLVQKYAQNWHDEQEAIRQLEHIRSAAPGVDIYDELAQEAAQMQLPAGMSTTDFVQGHLSKLVDEWSEESERLGKVLRKTARKLEMLGFNVQRFALKHLVDWDAAQLQAEAEKTAYESATRECNSRPLLRRTTCVEDELEDESSSTFSQRKKSRLLKVSKHIDELVPDAAPFSDFGDDVQRINVYKKDDDANDVCVPSTVKDMSCSWLGDDGTIRMDKNMRAQLEQHQIDAVVHIVRNLRQNVRGTLLAHAMGLGKSLSTIASIVVYVQNTRPIHAVVDVVHVIVVCPKSMVRTWVQQVHQWRVLLPKHWTAFGLSSTMTASAVGDTVRVWQQFGGFLVVGHDHFKKLCSMQQISIDAEMVLVCDEAHLIKNATTQLYKCIDAVQTRRRIMLTGSPMQNNMKEYYCMLQLVAPGCLGKTALEFDKSYGQRIEAGMQERASSEAIKDCERAVQVLRWQVHDIMHDCSSDVLHMTLPTKTEYGVLVKCSATVETMVTFSKSTQSCIVHRDALHTLTRADRLHVVEALVDDIMNDTTDKIVLFSTRLDTLKALAHTYTAPLFTGEVSDEDRTDILSKFDGDNVGATVADRILLVSTRAGGVGLNLTCANRVIIVDPSWNPVDDDQAVARIFRMGQKRPSYVYRIVASGTLEQTIYEAGIYKRRMASRVIDEQDMVGLLREMSHTSQILTHLAIADVKDAILSGVMRVKTNVIAIDHGAHFVARSVNMTMRERENARNEYNESQSMTGDLSDPSRIVPYWTEHSKAVAFIKCGCNGFEVEMCEADAPMPATMTWTPITGGQHVKHKLMVHLGTVGKYYGFRARRVQQQTGLPIGEWSPPSAWLYRAV